VSLEDLSKVFPCKIDTVDVFGPTSGPAAGSGADMSLAQISKDLLRDRIIVQGQRVEGSLNTLDSVLQKCAQAAINVITESGGIVINSNAIASTPQVAGTPQFCREVLDELCLTALRQIGRTESAFTSFSCLHHVVDMSLQPDIIIVPESTLARPLLMRFRRDRDDSAHGHGHKTSHSAPSSSSSPPPVPDNGRRPPAPPAAAKGKNPSSMMSYIQSMQPAGNPLICDLQAVTVYRFADAMTMHTILQVKVTFCRSIKLNPLNAKARTDLGKIMGGVSAPLAPALAAPSAEMGESGCVDAEAVAKEEAAKKRAVLHGMFVYSKNYVIIDKETKTSSRDWTEPN
jgi:hypothetical protein